MKKIFLTVALLFAATAYGQNTDSLITFIFKEKTDTARVRQFYDLYEQIVNMSPVKAIEVQQEVLKLAKKQKVRTLEAVTTSELGWLFHIAGSTVQGTQAMLEALKIAEKEDASQSIGIACHNLAITTSDRAKKKALSEKALKNSTLAGDYRFMCLEMESLYVFYSQSANRNMDSALYYAEKGYQLAMAKNMEVPLVNLLVDLSIVHRELGNNGLALEYLRTAEQVPVVRLKKSTRCMMRV